MCAESVDGDIFSFTSHNILVLSRHHIEKINSGRKNNYVEKFFSKFHSKCLSSRCMHRPTLLFIFIVIASLGEFPICIKIGWVVFLVNGVLHPRLVFGLFLHFSQKLQHIGDKDMFLIGNVSGNLIIALEFH